MSALVKAFAKSSDELADLSKAASALSASGKGKYAQAMKASVKQANVGKLDDLIRNSDGVIKPGVLDDLPLSTKDLDELKALKTTQQVDDWVKVRQDNFTKQLDKLDEIENAGIQDLHAQMRTMVKDLPSEATDELNKALKAVGEAPVASPTLVDKIKRVLRSPYAKLTAAALGILTIIFIARPDWLDAVIGVFEDLVNAVADVINFIRDTIGDTIEGIKSLGEVATWLIVGGGIFIVLLITGALIRHFRKNNTPDSIRGGGGGTTTGSSTKVATFSVHMDTPTM
jgi:hypothetical protein